MKFKVTIDSLVDEIEAPDEGEAIRLCKCKHSIGTSVTHSAIQIGEPVELSEVAEDAAEDEAAAPVVPAEKPKKTKKRA